MFYIVLFLVKLNFYDHLPFYWRNLLPFTYAFYVLDGCKLGSWNISSGCTFIVIAITFLPVQCQCSHSTKGLLRRTYFHYFSFRFAYVRIEAFWHFLVFISASIYSLQFSTRLSLSCFHYSLSSHSVHVI